MVGSYQILVRADCMRQRNEVAIILGIIFGPSGVRALPLAAGINEGGHYFRYFSFLFSLLLPPLFKTTEGFVVGFQIFAWVPK